MDAPHNLLFLMTTLNVTFTSKHVIHRASSIAFRATGSETLEVLYLKYSRFLNDFHWLTFNGCFLYNSNANVSLDQDRAMFDTFDLFHWARPDWSLFGFRLMGVRRCEDSCSILHLLWNCSTYLALVCKLAIESQGARLILEIKQSYPTRANSKRADWDFQGGGWMVPRKWLSPARKKNAARSLSVRGSVMPSNHLKVWGCLEWYRE
jgi:hypothetical protein